MIVRQILFQLQSARKSAILADRRIGYPGTERFLGSYLQPDRKRAKLSSTELLRRRVGLRVQPEQEAAQRVENLVPGEKFIEEPSVVRIAEQQRNEVVIVVVDVDDILRGLHLREVARDVQRVCRQHGPDGSRAEGQGCEIVPPPALQRCFMLPPPHV